MSTSKGGTHWFLPGLLMSLLLVACSSDSGTGPVEVKWDRDICDRCRMVLSDRYHSAEVRGGPEGQKARVYKFDDFGCAVLWLDTQSWKEQGSVELWVNDHASGQWIDAKQAYYVRGHTTAMEYGLGAQASPAEGALTYEQAVAYVRVVEARYNSPGTTLELDASNRR